VPVDADGSANFEVPALENREVTKFRESSKEKLQSYFEEHGYIDTGIPVKKSEAAAEVLKALKTPLAENRITTGRIYQLVNCVYLTAEAAGEKAGETAG
jgi:hypothetical protein